MADYYEARVDISDVVRTPATLTPDPPSDQTYPSGSFPSGANGPYYKFRATDFFTASPAGTSAFHIYINIECSEAIDLPGPDLEWLVTETHEWTSYNGAISAVFATFFSVNGTNGADFLNDVTLKIAKDEDNEKYVITGLMGNSELLFSDVSSPGLAAGSELAGSFLEVFTGPYFYTTGLGSPVEAVKTVVEVAFRNFYTEKNGVVTRGATLALGDRGTWAPSPGGPTYDPAYTPWWVFDQSPISYLIVNPDTGSAIVAGLVSGADLTGLKVAQVAESRYWDYDALPDNTLVDIIHAKEHGLHVAVYTLPTSIGSLTWEKTHDKFRSATSGIVATATGRIGSPSISWHNGRLYATFEYGGNVKQAVSTDLTGSWGVPTTIVSGTNPVHLVDPATGFSWYFYVDGGDLLLKRSGDFGGTFVDASPITVVSPIDTQTAAAQLALDGSLIVGYIDSGDFVQVRSSDLGKSWS